MTEIPSDSGWLPDPWRSHPPEDSSADPVEGTLGHGHHWRALGVTDERQLDGLIDKFLLLASGIGDPAPAPWSGGEYARVEACEFPQASIRFRFLCGVASYDEPYDLVSAYPVLVRSSEWIVRIEQTTDSYGPYEGTVVAETASGHDLEFFATDFAERADSWKRTGLARVALVGLGLSMETYFSDPWIIREGPMVELRKQELRDEGRHAEADDPDFHLTVTSDRLRTLFSDHHDHHMLIGKVRRVTGIRPRPEFQGWRLEVECLPDELPSGHCLVVYLFRAAWTEGAPPRKGQMIQGTIWLQGTWLDRVGKDDAVIWKRSTAIWSDE
ncbi:hypothetical protein [Haloferula sp. A504]|uniref:hypothetical protein n=1 Tax=Haloferula sp. A504 TaxID=3373601 RepID=UPI0031CB7712|nr:hypothetical protein [Verrucomicrobiaceae bacterium E54]